MTVPDTEPRMPPDRQGSNKEHQMKRTRDLYRLFGLDHPRKEWTPEQAAARARNRRLNWFGQLARDQQKARERHERMLLRALRRSDPVVERCTDDGHGEKS